MLHNNHWQYFMEYANLCLSALTLLSELFSKMRSKSILTIFSNRFQFRLKDNDRACFFEGDLLRFSHAVPHVLLYDKQAIPRTSRSFC